MVQVAARQVKISSFDWNLLLYYNFVKCLLLFKIIITQKNHVFDKAGLCYHSYTTRILFDD